MCARDLVENESMKKITLYISIPWQIQQLNQEVSSLKAEHHLEMKNLTDENKRLRDDMVSVQIVGIR